MSVTIYRLCVDGDMDWRIGLLNATTHGGMARLSWLGWFGQTTGCNNRRATPSFTDWIFVQITGDIPRQPASRVSWALAQISCSTLM